MTNAPTAAARSAGRILKLLGISALVLGLLGSVLGITNVVRDVGGSFADSFGSPIYTVPLQVTISARRGTNLILQDASYRNTGTTSVRDPAIQPNDVELTDPNGTPVGLSTTGSNFTITRNGAQYFSILQFHADAAGDYQLAVRDPAGLRLIVAPSLGEAFSRAGPWLVCTGVGILLVIGGAVLLIAGFVQSGKTKRPQSVAYASSGQVAPPPGWYPDPGRPGATRWWDGTRWRP